MIKEFNSWNLDNEKTINHWVSDLVDEALKQGTFGKAFTWLGKNKPELKGYGNGTAKEAYVNFVRQVYEEAYQELKRLSYKAETDGIRRN